uniref:Uncharacterized protein n=1 Tax=Anopheles epiroticus TaxID=199890 RepID=A0A182PPD7_9DIPT
MDEITRFKTWAAKLGCPLERIPPDEALKKMFRGDHSTFQHIMERVRSRQEIESMRKNVLVHKLQILKKTDSTVANASLNTLPIELQRYMKIQKLKKKIEETRLRIRQSVESFESINLQIKDKNVQKLQLMNKLEELYGKGSLYRAYETTLKANLEKQAQLTQRIERVMPVRGSESCRPEAAEKAIERCTQLLESFYEHFQHQNQETGRVLQEELWKDIRNVLRGIPNHLLWNVLLSMKDSHLREVAVHETRREESDHDETLSGLDVSQSSMVKLCTTHINVFLDVVSTRSKINTAREEYLAKGMYGQINEISKHMESELQQVRQIKQKVHYTKYVCQHTVHTMRQKNGANQTHNMSNQSYSRMDSTVFGGGPTYSPAALPSLVRELEVFRSIPLAKYDSRSKTLLLTLEPIAAIQFELSTVLALLPCTGVSAEVSLKQFVEIQQLERHAIAATNDSCSVVVPSCDHELWEQRWKSNHRKICELLGSIETLTNGSRQTLEKVRMYYNFALANNLRKYVPATKLLNGRVFREYENEFLMYYRMIYGFGGN